MPDFDDELDFLHIQLKTTIPTVVDDEDDRLTHSELRVFRDEAEETPIARGRIAEMPVWYNGDEEDDDNAISMDAYSGEAEGLHWAIRENPALFEDGINGFVLLEGLTVNADTRGQGVGRRILRSLVEHYARRGGNPSHFFLTAHPLEDRNDRDTPSWKDRDAKGFAKAQKRLMAFYERQGFQRLGGSDYMVIDLTRKLPPLEPLAA